MIKIGHGNSVVATSHINVCALATMLSCTSLIYANSMKFGGHLDLENWQSMSI